MIFCIRGFSLYLFGYPEEITFRQLKEFEQMFANLILLINPNIISIALEIAQASASNGRNWIADSIYA